ncbi:TonB-dependent receptor [Altererythrobacter sp. ZODW24]|uniref:TonB-dependent receptor n=1 Tax=Altererythrobacter sp. ZODW24 TaxID=2185142 RepID=UPI001F075767|nr:TonB-dependent receptor [Altererythrobacter sp. ZODW24]
MAKTMFFSSNASRGDLDMMRAALRGGASVLAMGSLLASAGAVAQDAAETPETELPADENVITVTGIRESLASAQTIKRDSNTVVDVITAKDIGALPDRSVTEALQRVPGVAINRFAGSNDPDHFSVEGSGVVIRGLNFVRSEFNGRDAFVAGVGGQALNFADVPSELLGSVIINKNSTADMIEGGLAGTVNLNTRKPFDNPGFQIGGSLEANYGDFRKDWTPTASLLISNTWDTDLGRFGLLASGSFSQIKSRADGLQITNYQARDGALVNAANAGGVQVCRNPLPGNGDSTTLPPPGSVCGTAGAAGADGFADYDNGLFAPLGGQFRTQNFNRKRDGFAVAAQFESIDQRTVVTAEFIRSHTTNNWGEYTYETAPDTAEYGTYPIGCLQNANGPNLVNTDGSLGDGTARAQCPVGDFQNYQYDDNGLFQSGYITNPNDGWRGNNDFVPIGGLQQTLARRQVEEETTNQDWGLNLKSELTDRLTIELDAQYATSRKQNLDVSVFGSVFADQELDLTGDLPVITPHRPNYLGYSWAGPDREAANASRTELNAGTEADYFSDPRFQFWRAAMDHIEDSEGEQFAFKADVGYEFDEDSFIRKVKVGARYSDRDQQVRYTTYNWGVLSEVWAGNRPVNFDDTGADTREYYEFPNFFRGDAPGPQGGYYYNGDLTGDYEGSSNFFQGVNALWQADGGNAGWVPLAQRNGAIAGSPYLNSDIQPIGQQDSAAYAMVSFGSDDMFGDVRFSGNIGLRYVNTSVSSEGNIGVGTAQSLGIADPFSVRCAAVVPPGAPPGTVAGSPGGVCDRGEAGYNALQAFADGSTQFDDARNDYSYFLPSLNLKFGVGDDVILRFAASKVLTRPDNAFLRNFLNVSLDGAGNLTAQSGNPFVRPATAWQFDATAEWYFARVGSLTFNAFYKEIDGFFYQAVTERQLTNNGQTESIFVRGPDNFDGKGKVKGFEVAYQHTFDFLPGFLSGFGVQANYTYIDSSGLPNSFLNGGNLANVSTVAPSGNLPLEQLSKHNINASVFYENSFVSARAAYNWRSRFLLTASDVIFPYYSIFNDDTGQLDASVFFNLTENVKVGVQGVNLTNEVTKTLQAYTGDPDQLAPRSYFANDRRFSFAVRFNF